MRRPRRCPRRSGAGAGAAPRTRRRARLASGRAAVGERLTIGPISVKGTAKTSCSTNATRSAGASVSITTSSASPTESPTGLVLWIHSLAAIEDRLGNQLRQGLLTSRLPGAEHVQAHSRHDGRQPCTHVLDVAHVGPAGPEPRFLDGVIGLGQRPEHAVGHRTQPPPVGLESLCQQALLRPSGHIPPSARVNPVTPGCGVV